MQESPAHTDGTAQPYAFDGGRTGVLLIHGWLGLPGELRMLGETLAERGHTVAGILLPGHGGPPEALHRIPWQHWYAAVVRSWRELDARCEQVVVVGFSLGGLLALRLAAEQRLDGLVTLAPALKLAGGWPLRLLGMAQYVQPWFYPLRRANFADPLLRADLASKLGAVDFDDPEVVDELRRSIRLPTSSIHQVVRLGRRVERDLPRITTPTLVLQGRHDDVVLPASAELTIRGLGSRDKQLAWFERSGHQLAVDVEGAQVRACVADWIAQRHAATPQPIAGSRR